MIILLGLILIVLVGLGLWYKEIRCCFYSHKMKRSHPECPEQCEYCGRDNNRIIHFHFNKRKT
jgi:hypothetical protein